MKRRLLSIEEVAERIGFSPVTVRKWTFQRLSGWPQPRRVGPQGELRWEIADIDRWIARQPLHAVRGKEVRA